MPAPNPLGALLARLLGLGPLVDGLSEVDALRDQVAALEGEQLRRETEWREARDTIYRHLKRVQAIEGKAAARDPDPMSAARRHALSVKLRPTNGG